MHPFILGYKILILVIGRLLIMSCSGGTWLLNYSLAYLIYSVAYIDEIINISLPMLTKTQAGEIAFTGQEIFAAKYYDMATSPYYCFFFLTFCFISIVLVSIFGDKNALPVSTVDVFGAKWSVSVFGIISVMAIITGGLIMATIRAFYLKKNGLLRGYARNAFFMRNSIDVPNVLAILSEVLIIFSCVIISAFTDAKAILVMGIFIPPIVGCLSYAYGVWVKNDYELVLWPPKEDVVEDSSASPSDLEVAFNMIEGLFGKEENAPETEDDIVETGEAKTLKGFSLPPLEVTSNKLDGPIKMPALPLKSVLRKKREKMGIKVKAAPIIKDLRAREGAEADKFGSGDVIDANDPWAQFEEKDDDDDEGSVKVEKKVLQYKIVRRGIFEHPFILKTQDAIMRNKVGKFVVNYTLKCFKMIQDRRRAYRKIDFEEEEDNEEDVENVNNPDGMKEKESSDKVAGTSFQTIAKMDFWSAFFGGFLNRSEYMAVWAWFIGLILILIMGCVMSANVSPYWLGHVIWVALIMFICTVVPFIKYFHTYVIDDTVKQFLVFLALFLFIFCITFFTTVLNADIGLAASLWILDFFFYYPAAVYIAFELFLWIDNGFYIEKLDKDGDGNITPMEYLSYFRAYPVLIAMAIILNWQYFLWIDYWLGIVCTLILLSIGFSYFFVRDWATNDFYISPEMLNIGNLMILLILFILFCVSLFSETNPVFPLSVFFFVLVGRLTTNIASKIMMSNTESIYFISPFILPVYSYNAKSNDLIDESPLANNILSIMVICGLWGLFVGIFIHPVSVGITMTCFILLFFSAGVAASISYIPMSLGKLSNLTTTQNIQEATNIALKIFSDRK